MKSTFVGLICMIHKSNFNPADHCIDWINRLQKLLQLTQNAKVNNASVQLSLVRDERAFPVSIVTFLHWVDDDSTFSLLQPIPHINVAWLRRCRAGSGITRVEVKNETVWGAGWRVPFPQTRAYGNSVWLACEICREAHFRSDRWLRYKSWILGKGHLQIAWTQKKDNALDFLNFITVESRGMHAER